MDDWKNPATYFEAEVARTVQPFLYAQGFSKVSGEPTAVMYQRKNVVLNFSYYSEDLPTPWIAVGVGFCSREGAPLLAGLWRAFDETDPVRRCLAERFDSPESLRNALRRIIDEVLSVHGHTLWDSEKLIVRLLEGHKSEAESDYVNERRRVDLLSARRAYEEGRFQEAVDKFALLDPSTLSHADRRRLYEARRHVERNDARPNGKRL